MKLNKRVATIVLLTGMLVGSLGAGLAFSGKPGSAEAAPVQQAQPVDSSADGDEDNTQDPSYTGSIPVDEAQTDGLNEASEAAALQGQAVISAAEAGAAAEKTNPGAKVLHVELDNENGYLVYEVEMDNGIEVKIDAGDAAILHSEQDNEADEVSEADEVGDTDDVQEEHEAENEVDDATEGPESPEDAPEAPEVVPVP